MMGIAKEGPSAGISIVTGIVSALTGRPVRNELAMTGEITIMGKVFAIGGVLPKLPAAIDAGCKEVIMPKENQRDVTDDPGLRPEQDQGSVRHDHRGGLGKGSLPPRKLIQITDMKHPDPNWFEVTLPTTELAVPVQTLATAQQGKLSNPETPRFAHRVVQSQGRHCNPFCCTPPMSQPLARPW